MPMPMLVGLCGRSGSGKGYVSEIFGRYGIPSIDTDAVYRSLTAPSETPSECMKELTERFGACVANPDNSLNRAKMRELVFSGDKEALCDLNTITHRHILARTEEIAAELYGQGYGIVLIDAPLLYESGFDGKCRKVIAVTAPEHVVIRRIMRRDGIDKKAAVARLVTQKSVSAIAGRADYVIHNDGNDEEMMKEIDSCLAELRSLAETV